MLYNMQIFDEQILVKALTHCPETLVAVGGGSKYPILQAFLSEVLE